MNGRIIVSKPLYVALAQRKEDRKAHLASQYMQRVTGMRMQQMGQVIAICFQNCVQIWKGRDRKTFFCRVVHKKCRAKGETFFYGEPCKKLFSDRNLSI